MTMQWYSHENRQMISDIDIYDSSYMCVRLFATDLSFSQIGRNLCNSCPAQAPYDLFETDIALKYCLVP